MFNISRVIFALLTLVALANSALANDDIDLDFTYTKCINEVDEGYRIEYLEDDRVRITIVDRFSESLDLVNPKVNYGWIGASLAIRTVLESESIKACSCNFKLIYTFTLHDDNSVLNTIYFIRDEAVSNVFTN